MFSTGLFSSSTSSSYAGQSGPSGVSPAAAGKKAQPPQFASFLLPSIPVPFRRRRSSAAVATRTSSVSSSSASASASPPSLCTSPLTSEADPYSQPGTPTDTLASPISEHLASFQPGLSRLRPDTLRCRRCSADVALASQIVSKGFTGRHGRAYLVGPCSPSPSSSTSSPPSSPGRGWGSGARKGDKEEGLANITVGSRENRQLVTGMHVVADISCAVCRGNLGWKYVDAAEPAQRYKIGKYILETARVVEFRSWEDDDVGGGERRDSVSVDQGQRVAQEQQDKARAGGSSRRVSRENEWVSEQEEEDDDDDDPVVFDSDDEEECEDIFAGVWDASVVAKRRSSRVSSGRR